jgi:hypothetical protein
MMGIERAGDSLSGSGPKMCLQPVAMLLFHSDNCSLSNDFLGLRRLERRKPFWRSVMPSVSYGSKK